MGKCSMCKVTGIILAGGKSQRMRKEKISLKIGEAYLIEVIAGKIKDFFEEIILIITNNSFKYQFPGIRTVTDVVPRKGPLGGIYTGLLVSQSKYNFICACDMPLLNLNLLKFMVSQINENDAVIPIVKGFTEPLHSVYSKNCLPAIKYQLQIGDLKIKNFFPRIKCKYIPEDKIKKYDPCLLSFFNLNTPQALELAKNLYNTM
ncbi:molybdenum cofactor guanylyltransferase [Patescibacteria group bacterium]|nr:molybdenum cofactor guanylyltransferase [Patescibacteria group bacterium]